MTQLRARPGTKGWAQRMLTKVRGWFHRAPAQAAFAGPSQAVIPPAPPPLPGFALPVHRPNKALRRYRQRRKVRMRIQRASRQANRA